MACARERPISDLQHNEHRINDSDVDNRLSEIEQCFEKVEGVKAQIVSIPDSCAGKLLVAVLLLSGNAADRRYTTIQKLQTLSAQEVNAGLIPHTYVTLGQLGHENFPPTKAKLAEVAGEYLKVEDNNLVRTNGDNSDNEATSIVTRIGPPTEKDMVHCQGNIDMAIITENLTTPRLEELGLSWHDVEDVFPAPDTTWIYLNRRRPQTWNQRIVYIANGTDAELLTEIWLEILADHPMFRALSIPVPKSLDARFGGAKHLFVTLRPNENLWYQSITTGLEVESQEDLHKAFLNQWADPLYGPLVHVASVKIRNTNSSALILIGNQAAFDKQSYALMLEDLNTALKADHMEDTALPVPNHVPFKELADHYWLCRSMPQSMEAASYHANRLRGIGTEQASLWPKQQAPGWFKGTDEGWLMHDGTPGDPKMRDPIDSAEHQHGLQGLTRSIPVQGLRAMQTTHGISADAVFKIAVALFNMRKTGKSAALFTSRETAPAWPGSASNGYARAVAGPTTHVVMNRVQLSRPDTTVLDLLRKEQNESVLLAKYAQAPLWQIIELLSPNDRDIFLGALVRQGYRSDAMKPAEESVLMQLEKQSLDDVGFTWSFEISDSYHVRLEATYDDCQVSKKEVYEAIGEVLGAVAWLVDPANVTEEVHKCIFESRETSGLVKGLV